MAGKTTSDANKETHFYESIRKRLNSAMEAKGWTQRTLEKKSGISQSSISRILNGPDKPDLYKLIKICKALDLKTDEVFSIKQNPYDKAIKKESVFVTDATHEYFQGYLGEYYAYFYSTKNKGKIHNGIFNIYKDHSSNRCMVSFNFKTGKNDPITKKPVEKSFIGIAKISMNLRALCCEMVDQDNSGDVSYIIFDHDYMLNQQCACRLGMVVTICAGLKRLPVAHKLLICRHKLKREELYYIDGQLKLNDDTIHVSEDDYNRFKEDEKLPDSIRCLVDGNKDLLVTNPEKKLFYTILEDDIGKREDLPEEDKAKAISLLRKYSNSKRCKKIGPKSDEFVFEILNGKSTSSDAKKNKNGSSIK